jgi:predicted Zn-dependent protease with MMP-like domain
MEYLGLDQFAALVSRYVKEPKRVTILSKKLLSLWNTKEKIWQDKIRKQALQIKSLEERHALDFNADINILRQEIVDLKKRITYGKGLDRTRRGGYREVILKTARENERLREEIATKGGKILPF